MTTVLKTPDSFSLDAKYRLEAGRVFLNARSQLSLSEEALAEAEPVLAVAVGLAIPGRNT